jgi:sigma-B regulation protein RsbU (phosphoserine phosphatase)
MARQVQESLLPLELPDIPGWAIARRWQPAREVAGDFYDVIPENGQTLGLVIADVTDKGMPASLFMAFTRSVLRASIHSGLEPASIIANANRSICQDSHEGLFTTLVYARLDPGTGALTYVNAGHNPPLLYHADSGVVDLLRRTGLPLGVDEDALYTQKTVQIQPGERLLFYTDGITEAINPAQQEFGIERLKNYVAALNGSTVDETLGRLLIEMDEFTDHAQSLDDVTLLAIHRLSERSISEK